MGLSLLTASSEIGVARVSQASEGSCAWRSLAKLLVAGTCAIGCTRATPAPPEQASARTPAGAATAIYSDRPVLAAVRSLPPSNAPLPSNDSRSGPEEDPGPALLTVSFREAIRFGLWQEAETHFSRLSKEEHTKPELRYARGRAAAERNDHRLAVELFNGLERELPEFGDDIRLRAARSALEAGPYDLALRYFGARDTPESRLNVALALERSGEVLKARELLSQIVIKAQNNRARSSSLPQVLVEARHARARVLVKLTLKRLAGEDLRWLALEVPHHPLAKDADLALEKLVGKKQFTKKERLERAQSFAEAADVEATETELARLEDAPGAPPPKAELLRVQAQAYYISHRDYGRAAELFRKAAEFPSSQRVEDLYHEARSLSRAQRDPESIEKYLSLAKGYPQSGFAEEARFRAARLQFIQGNWPEAIKAYRDYLSRYSKSRRQVGRFDNVARYELALTELASGQAREATNDLNAVIAKTSDRRRLPLLEGLLALAKLQANDRASATAQLRSIIAQYPLTFPALVSALRLSELGEAVPPPIPISGDASTAQDPNSVELELPNVVRMLHELGFDEDAEALLRDREGTLRRAYEPRGGEALCGLYAKLDTRARQFSLGQSLVRAEALEKAPTRATRWAWECLYPKPYAAPVLKVEREYRLPLSLIYAVMRQESGFRPRVVSSANAVGLLQLIPPTARRVAAELAVPYDPRLLESPPHNILFGAHYLGKLLDMFQGQVPVALAAYNAGPQAVGRWLNHSQELPIDLWVASIPYTETRNYVTRVINNWARYRYLDGGQAALPELSLMLPKGLRAAEGAY